MLSSAGMMEESIIPALKPEVAAFLTCLHDNLYRRNLEAVRILYEQELNVVTDKYYRTSRWPSISIVTSFYQQAGRLHSLIMALYSEIYYRHVFYLGEVTLEDRIESWDNYNRLLNYFIEDECSIERIDDMNDRLVLPASWVWDMLDEFVYQLQDTCRWRNRLGRTLPDNKIKQAELLKKLNSIPIMWQVHRALELLHSLAENPVYKKIISGDKISRLDASHCNLCYQIGYFASVSLLRLHVLIGDYLTSVKVISDIHLAPKSLYWKVPACHITLFYYMGFAYMMLRRYNDSIKILSQLLMFLAKQRGYLVSQSYQQVAMNRQTEKMYLMIILCQSLTHQKLDETILQTIKETYSNKFYQLQSGNEEAYRETFGKACPKFINPAMPNIDSARDLEHAANQFNEPVQRQTMLFLQQVEKQRRIDEIFSYAKLYHNIDLKKLSSFMDDAIFSVNNKKGTSGTVKSDIDSVRSHVLAVKHLTRQVAWKACPLLYQDDTITSTLEKDVDFYVDNDLVHIKSHNDQKLYINYFIQQIQKTKQQLEMLSMKL